MRDPMRDVVEQLGVDYHEFMRLPIQPWQQYLGFALFVPIIAVGAFWIFEGLYSVARLQYAHPTAIAYVGVPLLAFLVAFFAFILREVIQTLAYPILEIGVGLAAVVQPRFITPIYLCH
jgi:hypothetical protein